MSGRSLPPTARKVWRNSPYEDLACFSYEARKEPADNQPALFFLQPLQKFFSFRLISGLSQKGEHILFIALYARLVERIYSQ